MGNMKNQQGQFGQEFGNWGRPRQGRRGRGQGRQDQTRQGRGWLEGGKWVNVTVTERVVRTRKFRRGKGLVSNVVKRVQVVARTRRPGRRNPAAQNQPQSRML